MVVRGALASVIYNQCCRRGGKALFPKMFARLPEVSGTALTSGFSVTITQRGESGITAVRWAQYTEIACGMSMFAIVCATAEATLISCKLRVEIAPHDYPGRLCIRCEGQTLYSVAVRLITCHCRNSEPSLGVLPLYVEKFSHFAQSEFWLFEAIRKYRDF